MSMPHKRNKYYQIVSLKPTSDRELNRRPDPSRTDSPQKAVLANTASGIAPGHTCARTSSFGPQPQQLPISRAVHRAAAAVPSGAEEQSFTGPCFYDTSSESALAFRAFT